MLSHLCIRSETTALRLDRDKMALESDLSKERLNSSMMELEHQVLTIPFFVFIACGILIPVALFYHFIY
jgi:hypothetical protein